MIMMATPTPGQKGPSQRQLKVGEQVRQILSEIIARNEIHNDILERAYVSICEVRMSPDLRHGKAYVSSLMGNSMAEAVQALNECEYHFRKGLSKELQMKFLPKIQFFEDETFYEANKIQDLLSLDRVAGDVNNSEESS